MAKKTAQAEPKEFTIRVVPNGDGYQVIRQAQGFSEYELLGHLYRAIREVEDRLNKGSETK
jgi:hypothetical protein